MLNTTKQNAAWEKLPKGSCVSSNTIEFDCQTQNLKQNDTDLFLN